jgi:hypothetical protein
MQNNHKSNLIQQSDKLIDSINNGVDWAEKNLRDSEQSSVLNNLKNHRRIISKTRNALTGKPVLALFGASQVGKSYMANNLLYNNDNLLLIHDHSTQNEIDFIKNINPEGKGNEATSTVTRFTSEKINDINKKPVKLKLFNVKDVILILIDGYFSDYIENGERSNAEKIHKHIEFVTSLKSNEKQIHISDDDVYEIKEYLVKHFAKTINEFLYALNSTKFWDFLAATIQYIPIHKSVEVFNILWNYNQPISDVYTIALQELEKLKFSKVAHVDFSAIERESKDDSISAIINVKSLSTFFENDGKINVQLDSENLVNISSSKLCFLTSEIVLTVSQSSIENRPFIQSTDIIDFPGARSRDELRDLSDQSRIYMLLRGKVSYLFNLYSSNFLTNTLFVCMRTQQTNVSTMPRLIKQWIQDNIGETDVERGVSLGDMPPPLFVIFTWWNTQLQYKEKTDNMNPLERIQKQFETRFHQEVIGSYDWHENWATHQGQKKQFKNFYFLRDFKESELIYKSENGSEVDFYSEPQETFYNIYRNEMVNYHKEKSLFFDNPELSFDEASEKNKDGSEFIIKNLTALPFEKNFIEFHEKRINESHQGVLRILKKYHHDENQDKQYLQAIQDASSIHLVLNRIFGMDSYFFGKLMELLQINEKDIFEINHDALRDVSLVDNSKINEMVFYKIHSPRLILGQEFNTEENYKFNLNVLKEDYKRESLDDTEMFFAQRGINLYHLFFGVNTIVNKSDAIAEKVSQYWFNNVLIPERFFELIELGFEASLIEKLLQNVKNNFTKNNMNRVIANQIKDYVDLGKRLDEAEDLVAHMIATVINNFVNAMGWKSHSENELNLLLRVNQTYKLDLKIPEEESTFISISKLESPSNHMHVEELINITDRLNETLSNSKIDQDIVNNIPMIKYYNNWIELMKISFIETCDIPNYDIYSNKKLGECLKEFEQIKLN